MMTTFILNDMQVASSAGEILVYNFDRKTLEYISATVEYIPIGVGIPADSCIDVPLPDKSGFAICRSENNAVWEYIEDHRGEIVYSISDGNAVEVDYIGAIPEGFVNLAPLTPFDIWDGQKWILDEQAQTSAATSTAEKMKASLRIQADQEITWRQDAVDKGIATANEAAALEKWIIYRISVMRVDTANPVWPELPVA